MNTLKIIPLIIIFSLFQSCKKESEVKKIDLEKNYSSRSIDKNTSLIALIANPEKFQGKRIRVTGYLNLEFEGDAIYLNELDCKNGIYENAFWVNFADKIDMNNRRNPSRKLHDFNHKYVSIEGVFNKNRNGHMSLFAGEIDNIDRIFLTFVEEEKEFKNNNSR